MNLRYPPDRDPSEAEAYLASLVPEGASFEVVGNAPPGRVATESALVEALRAAGDLEVEAKQAWTNVADFTEHGVDAVNFGPGHTALRARPRRARRGLGARSRVRDARALPRPPGPGRSRLMDIVSQIEALWDADEVDPAPIEEAIRLVDAGEVRVAEKRGGGWVVNEWVKKAILLYFRVRKVEPIEAAGSTSSTRSR